MVSVSVVRVWSSFLPFLQFVSDNTRYTAASSHHLHAHTEFDPLVFSSFCMQYECKVTAKQNPNLWTLQIPCRSPGEPISCKIPSVMVPFLPSSSRKSPYQQLARPLWPLFVTSFRMVAGLTKAVDFLQCNRGKSIVLNYPNFFPENTRTAALHATPVSSGRKCRACLELVYLSKL